MSECNELRRDTNMSFIVVSRIGWLVVRNELIGSTNSLVSFRVTWLLCSSAVGESASSLGFDLAGLQERGVEALRELRWEPVCELGLWEGRGELLAAAGERPPAQSWINSRSAGGKKCRSF